MDEIEQQLLQARRLRFAGETETQFRAWYMAGNRITIRFSLILAAVLYAVFGILDAWCLPQTHGLALFMRFAIVCPLLLVAAAVTGLARWARIIQPVMTLVAVVSGSAIVLMIGWSKPSELGHTHYYVGLILVLMFVYSFIRLFFWNAVVANLATMALFEVVAIDMQGLLNTASGITLFVSSNFFLVSANVIGILTCYWLELAARQNFIHDMALEEEKAKSERLLLNILPEAIVERMKSGGETIADEFKNVSVLFADLVDFSVIAGQVSPKSLVEMLNKLFTEFDKLALEHGVEKIKTIGDCYMVAAGVPVARADHAQVLTSLALDMRAYIESEANNPGALEIRIGISSGPVVAGVIGRNKFIYDLWGDTVNTASRMESHGDAGQIQITEATHELIKDDFIVEPAGVRSIKGKGDMRVWHVVDRATAGRYSVSPGQVEAR